jgi:hypothetical protein
MIVYSKLGNKGNFGNHLFQIASTIGIAIKNGHEYGFPEWIHSKNFNYNFPLYDNKLVYDKFNEKAYHYSDLVFYEGQYDLNGWFQSEKYFNSEIVKNIFKFKIELVAEVKEKYKKVFSKKNLLISVRRGDFVHHPYYFQLDYKYYFLAIITQFPDWEKRHLIFTSDDINYCKRHFSFLPNAFFIEKSNAVEQLVLGSLCDDFIISNSTFSWWQAWLGENKNTKIIRPIQNFRGTFRLENNDKDYFPDRWISFDPKLEKKQYKYRMLLFKGEFFKTLDFLNFKCKYYKKKLKILIKKQLKRD